MKKMVVFLLIAIPISHLVAQDKKMKITINNSEFKATLNNGETVDAFVQLLPLEINMSEMGGYEKYFYLPQNLPGSAMNVGTTKEGDLMIWSSNCLVLFYVTRSTSYNYIKLGRIDDTTGLRDALGSGNVKIKFELEGQSETSMEIIKKDQDQYKLSPNPFAASIQVSGEFDGLYLFNLDGILVAQSKEDTIHTSNLPSGIYFLKIDSGKNGFVTKKVIIKC